MSQTRAVFARLVILAILLPMTAAVYAQAEDIEQEFDVAAGGTLDINSDSGPIEVNTWDQNRVRIRIRNTEGFEIQLQQRGDDIGFDRGVKFENGVAKNKLFNVRNVEFFRFQQGEILATEIEAAPFITESYKTIRLGCETLNAGHQGARVMQVVTRNDGEDTGLNHYCHYSPAIHRSSCEDNGIAAVLPRGVFGWLPILSAETACVLPVGRHLPRGR